MMMHPMSILLCLCFCFVGTLCAPNIIGVVTELGGSGYETVEYTVKVDLATGTTTNLVKNLVYAGSSATVDGISAFDSTNQIIYYATDYIAPFVFSVDVKNQQLLAPISFGVYSIADLEWDKSQSRLLALVATQQQGSSTIIPQLISYYPGNTPYSLVTSFSVEESIETAAVASADQIYYWISRNTTGSTFLNSLDLNSPTKTSKVHVQLPTTDYIPFLAYDSAQETFYGIVEVWNPKLSYRFLQLQPNGKLQISPINLPFGIATGFAYDKSSSSIYFAYAQNGSPLVVTLDTQTSKTSSVVTQNILEDIMVFDD